MAKLSRKELDKIAQQMAVTPDRGATWCGFRPAVMQSKKHNKKAVRRENKRYCQEW